VEAAAASLVAELELHFGSLHFPSPACYPSSTEAQSAATSCVGTPAPPQQQLLLQKAIRSIRLALMRRAAEAAEARRLRGIEEATSGETAAAQSFSPNLLPRRLRDHSSYFCSHLVADVLAETHALHLNAALYSHHMLPADFSSSALSPGASLWMNCGKGHETLQNEACVLADLPSYPGTNSGVGGSLADGTLVSLESVAGPTYALSPDIVFDVPGEAAALPAVVTILSKFM
jgi:hypothetical protein